jgi:radical SAM protein with 4Fe4S-binding SPASM domain
LSVEGPSSVPESPNLYNEQLASTERHHRLIAAHWELTYRCNEKCTHCYLDVFAPHAHVPGELTTEECLRVVDEMAALGVLNLTFSGGEILVRRDFFEIAEYAHSKRFLLRLFTNGILIKPEVADRIAALHPYAVEISLYSVNPEIHDRITQRRHSWELTTRALRLLRERGIRTVMKTPFMRENVGEADALEAFAKDLGARFRYDITITPKDTGGLAPLQHRLTYDDLVSLFRKQIDPSLWVGRTVTDSHRTCGITLNSLTLDPYGNVFPCVQTRAKAGNVREQSLREIWQSSPVWRQLGQLTLSELPVCRTCELRTLCVRCHGLALTEDGDLRAPAMVNCREALARRQALIDRGELPADFPIPAHLQDMAALAQAPTPDQLEMPSFIPSSALNVKAPNEFAAAGAR